MRWNKLVILNFLLLWLSYELVLLLGIGMANLGLVLTNSPLPNNLPLDLVLITMSFITVSLFAVTLRGKSTITARLYSHLLLAAILASLANFQTILTISVLVATTFLYECHPFYLRRWSGFFAIKYAIDMTAVLLLGLFLLWQYIGHFAYIFFLVFYLILLLVRHIFWLIPRKLPNKR